MIRENDKVQLNNLMIAVSRLKCLVENEVVIDENYQFLLRDSAMRNLYQVRYCIEELSAEFKEEYDSFPCHLSTLLFEGFCCESEVFQVLDDDIYSPIAHYDTIRNFYLFSRGEAYLNLNYNETNDSDNETVKFVSDLSNKSIWTIKKR